MTIKTPKTKKRSIEKDSQAAITRLNQEALGDVIENAVGMVENEDGSITFDIAEEPEEARGLGAVDLTAGHYANRIEELDEDTRNDIASLIIANTEADDQSRSEWLGIIEKGLNLLGVKLEEANTPFIGACSAQHPLLMESAVKFQSKASSELFPPAGPVKSLILGDVTVEREEQANRIKAHMNYQITEQMTEFFVDSEKNLLYLSLVGSGFKKTYYNSALERPSSEFVPADQLIVPNTASDLYRAPRFTHVLYKTPNQLAADFEAGLYKKPKEIGTPSEPLMNDIQEKSQKLAGTLGGVNKNDMVYTLYEQNIELHIPELDDTDSEFEVASPYVITVDANSREILGLRRNWEEGDEKRRKQVNFTHFTFVPSLNFYGYGFLHLLGNLQLTLTASLRSLVDAGQFSNLQGGFKLKGVRIADNNSPISPGQFKEIDSPIMDISKSVMALPFKEPSHVLYQMLEYIDRKGQKFADATEQVVGDASNYGPVGTTMALLDASTKFFSAIHKRLHASLRHELKLIAKINSETLPDDLEYNIENATMAVSRADYDNRVDVSPVSDPNIPSSSHRLAKAQTFYEFAMRAPEVHDMREVMKHVYTNMDFVDIDKVLPEPDKAEPQDPLTDIQLAVDGKPIKAFEGQDHAAHIATEQAFLQNPNTGQSPFMQGAIQALQAHIKEHQMMQFMEQVKAAAPDTEDAAATSQAAQQIAQMNLEQQKQQLEEGQQDDAAMLLAQAEMADTQVQAQKNEADVKLRAAELALKKADLDLKILKEQNRAKEVGIKHAQKKDEIITTKAIDAMADSLATQATTKGNPQNDKPNTEE